MVNGMDWSSCRTSNELIKEEERVFVIASWVALFAKEKRKKFGEKKKTVMWVFLHKHEDLMKKKETEEERRRRKTEEEEEEAAESHGRA